MRFGPVSFSRRRTLRGVAGFIVAFLLAGQAMAATGCCSDLASMLSLPDQSAVEVVCADHAGGDPGSSSDTKRSCPAEEPTPQARAVDLPGAQPVAAILDAGFYTIGLVAHTQPPARVASVIPPPPLYARLQRLRL